MRRSLAFLAVAIFVVGCGEKTKTSETKSPATNDQVVEKAPDIQVHEEVIPVVDEATRFAEKLQTLSEKAHGLQSELKFAEAQELWTEIETMLTEQFGAESWQTVNARIAAATCREEAEFDEATLERLKAVYETQAAVGEALRERDLQKALQLSQKSSQDTQDIFGATSFMMGKQLMQVARLNQQAGNYPRATNLYLQSLLILEKHLGKYHPDVELGFAYVGEIYLDSNNHASAIANLSTATEIARKIWGEASLRYAARANDLGVAFYRDEQHESALKILRAAEAIRRNKLSENHPQVAHSLSNLGIVYLDMKRLELADQCLTQAYDLFVKHYGQVNQMTSECQLKLATTRMLLGKYEDAEQLLGKLLGGIQDNTDPLTAASLQYRLAIALSKQGKYERAEPLFKIALAEQTKALGESHQLTLKTMEGYASLLKASNRNEDASKMTERIASLNAQASDSTFR